LIVVDTSAIIAIANFEAEASAIHAALTRSSKILMSTGNLLEVHLVTTATRDRYDIPGLLALLRVQAEAVTVAQLDFARVAHDRYGRGSGHRAKLNYGDCFAYALAKSLDAPLLFKGNDFAHTDIEVAPY